VPLILTHMPMQEQEQNVKDRPPLLCRSPPMRTSLHLCLLGVTSVLPSCQVPSRVGEPGVKVRCSRCTVMPNPDPTKHLCWGQSHIKETGVEPVSGEASMVSATPMACPPPSAEVASASTMVVVPEPPEEVTNMLTVTVHDNNASGHSASSPNVIAMTNLSDLPNEVLLQILGYLDVCDLLATSRVSSELSFLSMGLIGIVTGWTSSAHNTTRQEEAGGLSMTSSVLPSPSKPPVKEAIVALHHAHCLARARNLTISSPVAYSLLSRFH
jgi:hypothetical protein